MTPGIIPNRGFGIVNRPVARSRHDSHFAHYDSIYPSGDNTTFFKVDKGFVDSVATSGESIRQAMKNVLADLIVVVIAHCFSLVRNIDLVLVMEDGRLVQSGTHDELVATAERYRTL